MCAIVGGGYPYRDERPPYRGGGGGGGGGPPYDRGAPSYRDERYDGYPGGPPRGGDRGGYDSYRHFF